MHHLSRQHPGRVLPRTPQGNRLLRQAAAIVHQWVPLRPQHPLLFDAQPDLQSTAVRMDRSIVTARSLLHLENQIVVCLRASRKIRTQGLQVVTAE